MSYILDTLQGFHADNILRAIVLLFIGYLISRFVSASLNRSLQKRFRPHQMMIIRRVIFFTVFLLFFASAIQQIGFRISALLGATGILTVAIGIASQTSMSNLISGLFIIGEKPFEIGDSVTIDTISGEIISIDFMSVRIRTAENTMIRVPNETLIKSAITNLTWFPTRRLTIPIDISYDQNIEVVQKLLMDVAQNNTLVLSDPTPRVLFDHFGQAITLQLLVWTKTENLTTLKDSIQTEIKSRLDEHSIKIPYTSQALTINQCVPLQISLKNKVGAQLSHEKNL